jgi:hypothetical protein
MASSSEQAKKKGGHFTVTQEFFEEAIQRYTKSKEERDGSKISRAIPPKKRLHDATKPLDNVERDRKVLKKAFADKTASLDASSDDSGQGGPPNVAKKRLASRVSSRRTREREKLRLDHFRSAKMKFELDNSKLKEDNLQLRDLIKRIKKEQGMLNLKTAVVQSMLVNQSSAPQISGASPSGFGSLSLPGEQQTGPQQPSLLLNAAGTAMAPRQPALLFNAAGNTTAPQQPNLLYNVAGNTTSSTLAAPTAMYQQQQPQQQQQQLLALLQPLLGLNPGVLSLLSNPLLQSTSLADHTNTLQRQLVSLLAGTQSNQATTVPVTLVPAPISTTEKGGNGSKKSPGGWHVSAV